MELLQEFCTAHGETGLLKKLKDDAPEETPPADVEKVIKYEVETPNKTRYDNSQGGCLYQMVYGIMKRGRVLECVHFLFISHFVVVFAF